MNLDEIRQTRDRATYLRAESQVERYKHEADDMKAITAAIPSEAAAVCASAAAAEAEASRVDAAIKAEVRALLAER